MKTWPIFRLMFLSVIIFIFFNATPFVSIFWENNNTPKDSVVYALDVDIQCKTGLETLYNIGNANNLVCDEDRRNQLGLNPCPSPVQNAGGALVVSADMYCADKNWVYDCMLRYISDANNGTENGGWNKFNCAAGEEVPWDGDADNDILPWSSIRDTVIDTCHNCLDACWFENKMGSFSFDVCVEKGISGTDLTGCKANVPDYSFDVYESPSRMNASCGLQGWIDAWHNEREPAEGSPEEINKLCDMGCADDKVKNKDDCLNTCKSKPTLHDAVHYLSVDLKVSSESGISQGNQKANDVFSAIFNFGNIGAIDYGAIAGGFGYGSGPLDIPSFIKDVWDIGKWLFAGLAIIKIIFGGIMYATAAGNAQRITSAKEHILYAIIGLVVIILANIILTILGIGGNGLLN